MMENEWAEAVDKFNYLEVTLESMGGLNKQKTLAKMKGYQAVVVTDKCVSINPTIKIQMLENIHQMVF
jgi:hypothetical protein